MTVVVMRFMKALHSVPLLAALVASSPTTIHPNNHATRQNTISWKSCTQNSEYECATFSTPLDYFNPSVGNAELAVIRYKARNQPRLGSLLVNPGGPGLSGFAFIESLGQSISESVGGYYDIIGWDPRGINNTIPRIDCFTSNDDNQTWVAKLDAIDIKTGRTFTAGDADHLRGQTDNIDATLSAYFEACSAVEGEKLKYVGTAATVRDMVAMVDAMDGIGSPVNYWGYSYGTIIGSYLVNMFPERVGRVVLDGNVGPFTWSSQPPHLRPRNYLVDSEKAFDGFCKACAEAGPRCVLARGRDATQIKDYILSLMDDIQRVYIHGFYYSTADFRFDLFCGMYFPMFWNVLAQEIFKRAEEIRVFSATGHNPESRRQNGLTPLKRRLRKRIAMGSAINPVHFLSQLAINKAKGDGEDDDILPMNEHAYHAITCGDAIDTSNITTRVMLDEIISVTENVSPLYGPALSSEAGNYCHRWGVRAAERFTGPWNATLANRILVTGNTADPITPLSNSKWVADQFGDKATLLIQNAYGHTSYSMPSACTLHAIERYLISGELPSQNTTCETDTRLFDSPTGEAFVPDNVWDPPKATPVQAGSRISNSATYWKPSTSSFVLNGIFCIALSILIS